MMAPECVPTASSKTAVALPTFNASGRPTGRQGDSDRRRLVQAVGPDARRPHPVADGMLTLVEAEAAHVPINGKAAASAARFTFKFEGGR